MEIEEAQIVEEETTQVVVNKVPEVKPSADGKSLNITVPIDTLRQQKVFLATPMYGGMCAGMYTRAVSDLTAQFSKLGIPLQIYFLFNESLITRARNYCVDEFMRSGATHLMFIDSDIGFQVNDVLTLLALQSDESEYDVIAAPYPKKCISWEKILLAVNKGMADTNPNNLEQFVGDYVFNPKNNTKEIPIAKPVEVMEAGTGFMMIRRRTFEKINKAFPELLYKPDHVRTAAFDGSREIMMYFQAAIDRSDVEKEYKKIFTQLETVESVEEAKVLIKKALDLKAEGSKRYLSEDYWFCQLVQKIGLKVFFCPWISLSHVGSYVFSGSLAALATIGASATADPSKLGKK